ncbi:1,4-alpha-glucan branching enzyme GlgB [Geothrix rubra]|uniref:1,4-alpha-glucan branching enzyme GlgB n=1 Tax=Geothrix rubra TaxID=2927977 RepID=A0ABQ5Q1M2_9BACT|nr:1,4-alpha-glucan branching enzyme GlgB [Geothrix rubra]
MGGDTVTDQDRFPPWLGPLDHHLLSEGTHRRAYEKLGAHPAVLDGVAGTAFAVWAPSAQRVSVVGPFNDWDGRRHPMRSSDSGVWERFVPDVGPGDLYKFELTGPRGEPLALKADPFAFRCEVPPRTASVVHGLGGYAWGDAAWMGARGRVPIHRAPFSAYEVHLGSWRRRPDGRYLNYREIAEQLIPYVTYLGFTHVELLPVSEHPFYGSWGYQPLGLFAPTGRYGTPEDFKAFVDAFHQAGLGVVLDWVPAHFPEDAHGLTFFDGTHLYEHADPRQGRLVDWGTLAYNYGRREVQTFLIANALYWLDQFHVDGLRVDAVASMLYLDYSRKEGQWVPNRHGGRENLEAVAFLRRLNEAVYAEHPDAFTIAEESTAWPMVSRPTSAGGLGFGFKWNMGWMHDTLLYFSRTMLHRRFHHDELTFSMLYHGTENYVLPLSHDEVVHGKRSLLGRMPGSDWERLANLRLLLAWTFAHPGKKLLFMGTELGQEREWNHATALDWELLDRPDHKGIHDLLRDLNALYRARTSLHEGDCEPGGFSWIEAGDRANSVLSLLRLGPAPGDLTVVILNFTALVHRDYRVGVPVPGPFEECLNTDGPSYGGQGFLNPGSLRPEPIPLHGCRQSIRLTLPPLGAVFLRPTGGGVE